MIWKSILIIITLYFQKTLRKSQTVSEEVFHEKTNKQKILRYNLFKSTVDCGGTNLFVHTHKKGSLLALHVT